MEVYDYAAGEADWLAWGLPRESRAAQVPTVGAVARRDVATCGLADRVANVKARAQPAGYDACVVVNAQRVVLGLLRGRELDADPAATAEPAKRRRACVSAGWTRSPSQRRMGCSWACCGARTPSAPAQPQGTASAEPSSDAPVGAQTHAARHLSNRRSANV